MKKALMFMVCCLLLSLLCHSQTLRGKIISEDGSNVPFVAITSLRDKKAVTANGAGVFTVSLTQVPDTLVFSAAGYETYSVVVTGKTVNDPDFEVVLLQQRQSLSEVVVTGYGTTRRKDLTGSVTTVRGVEVAGIASSPVGSPDMETRSVSLYEKSVTGTNYETKPKLITADSTSVTEGTAG